MSFSTGASFLVFLFTSKIGVPDQELYDLWVVQYENTVEESTFVKTTRIFKNHITSDGCI
ncbi:hypothetical protein ACIQ7N_05940 [Lysinibacillus sp. NPDC095746]|uniref:hypothetical protein n=1 Tax=Lysinibacillus sp. NPDC095746 TaxID=3364134 RepID=UPI0038135F92